MLVSRSLLSSSFGGLLRWHLALCLDLLMDCYVSISRKLRFAFDGLHVMLVSRASYDSLLMDCMLY